MGGEQRARVNRSIRVPEVRLIGKDGENLGIVKIQDALAAAAEAELDLVEISPTANPPVCQITDYDKYRYDQEKKDRLRRKNQKQKQKLKEIKIRPGTGQADYLVKVEKLKEFLEEGNKAKITLRFRGREISHQEYGEELLHRIEQDLKEFGIIEQSAKREGKQIVMVFAPKKVKI